MAGAEDDIEKYFAGLGRPLCLEEVQEVSNIDRRITAILLPTPKLDANYAAVKEGGGKLHPMSGRTNRIGKPRLHCG